MKMKMAGVLCAVLLCSMFPSFALAETFSVIAAAVSADSSGSVVVETDSQESGWVLVQFCQDNLRPSCGNNQLVRPSSDAGGKMTFQLEPGGARTGQVAFNFRRERDKKWLAIPDCRVKIVGNLGVGMSFVSSAIPESGGAHFVYTGSGFSVWSPVDMGICDPPKPTVATAPVAKPVAQSGSSGQVAQSVTKSPESQNAAVGQTAKQETKVSGNGNTVKKKTVQQSATVNNKGATVKINGNVSAKDCKDAAGNCVPAIDARTNNFSLISLGAGQPQESGMEKDYIVIKDGKVVYDCKEKKSDGKKEEATPPPAK